MSDTIVPILLATALALLPVEGKTLYNNFFMHNHKRLIKGFDCNQTRIQVYEFFRKPCIQFVQ